MEAPDQRARWSSTTFLLAFGFTLFLLALISLEFLVPLVLALSAAILLGDANEWVVRKLGGRRNLVALAMSVATFAVILAPLTLIVIVIVNEAVPLIQRFVEDFGSGRIASAAERLIPARVAALLDLAEVQSALRQQLANLGSRLASFAASLPVIVANLSIDAFVTFVALFVYFARGPQLADAIVEATPMERRHTRNLLETIAISIRTVFAASFITAVIQFGLGWLGFRLASVPYALALAAVMAFFSFLFSLVPVLGSGLVWVPVGVVLFFDGRPLAGLFVLLWGALVLGSVDNVVKPLYAKGQLQLSPLLVFVTIFGGISVLGPIGAVLGPLIAALAAAFLRIWTTEFLPDATPLPRLAPSDAKKRPRLLARLRRRRA